MRIRVVRNIARAAALAVLLGGLVMTSSAAAQAVVSNVGRIAQLSTDGALISGFTTGTGFNDTVRAIAAQSNGGTIAVGQFTSFQGKTWDGTAVSNSAVATTVNGIARITPAGALDTTFSRGTGFPLLKCCRCASRPMDQYS